MLGRPLGIPKTGIFGLADLVGIDLLPHVAASLRAALPPDDPFHEVDREWPLVATPDRDRLHRTQGQGRLLPPEPGRRAAGQGGDRPRDRQVSRRRQAAPRLHRRREGRSARVVRERRARGALRLAGNEPDARLRLLAGARDRRRHRRGRWRDAPRLQLEMGTVRAARPDRPGLVPRSPRRAGHRRAAAPGAGRRGHLLPDRARPAPVPERRRRLRRRRAAGRRAAPCRRQAAQQAGRQERLGVLVGHRRRRRLFRVPQQDELDRPGHARSARQGDRVGRQGFQGAGRLQRGRELLGRRQRRASRCSPPTSPPGR